MISHIKADLGRIQGQVTDANTNLPIPNVMVTAGGIQTITSSDGSFLLEGLSPGTHNLVAYSIEGTYQPFAQGAVVATDFNYSSASAAYSNQESKGFFYRPFA